MEYLELSGDSSTLLQERLEWVRLLFTAHPQPMWMCDAETLAFLDVNDAAIARYQYSRDEFLSMTLADIRPEEDLPRLEQSMRARAEGLCNRGEWRHRIKDGTLIDVEIVSSTLRVGGRTLFIAAIHDITERKRTEAALRHSQARYAELFENANDIVFTTDLQGHFTSFNKAAERISGYTREDALHISRVLSPEDLQRALQMIQRKLQDNRPTMYEVDLIARDGRRVPIELSTRLIIDKGVPVGIHGIARDVTDRRAVEAKLEHQALHDALTGLPNRALFHDRTQQALLNAQRDGIDVSVLLMDVDRFKEINDTFGHEIGDQLLQTLGARLQSIMGPSQTVARLGGDEFAILLPHSDVEDAARIADYILREVTDPFTIGEQSFHVSASIGIAVYPDHGDDAHILFQRADVAMYMAKRGEGGWSVYAPERDENSADRLALIADLRRAIACDDLFLVYQPQAHLQTGDINHVEALVRWNHPRLGVLTPDRFIGLAETSGLIRDLTRWVLSTALRQVAAWRASGLPIRVAVNLSARNLHDSTLPEQILGLLRQWNADPSWLEVEITESAIMVDPEHALQVVQGMHALGIRVSIDDFGTGYSSFAALRQLPVSEIKIDKSFVMGMASNASDAVIVRSVIDLARNLGMQVVAEGVENEHTWAMLVGMQCTHVQGYYISPPLPATDLTSHLGQERSLPA